MDAIIEVGAVRFADGLPTETFTTLINPDRPIPYEITMLTGITDRDVLGKPRFEQIAAQLRRFVGASPVVGHNVSFDLGFLRAQQLFYENIGLDTWELATILLPNMPGYSLGSLADRLGIPMESRHRAEHDAQATGLLFAHLCDEAARLPRPTLVEINRLARNSDWPLAAGVPRGAGRARGRRRGRASSRTLEQIAPDSALLQPLRFAEPLMPVEDRGEPVDVAELIAMLRSRRRGRPRLSGL